jgi:hypothetical protein
MKNALTSYINKHCFQNSVCLRDRAFFNYITGGPKPPQPPWWLATQPFCPPPQSNSLFSKILAKTWNLKGSFDILVTEICFVIESYVLSFIFNAKHCVVNTLLDFTHFAVDCIYPRPYRFELLEGSAKHVSDRRGQRAPNPVFYKGGGIILAPIKNPNWFRNRIWNRIYIYNQISIIDILITTFLVIIHSDSRIA